MAHRPVLPTDQVAVGVPELIVAKLEVSIEPQALVPPGAAGELDGFRTLRELPLLLGFDLQPVLARNDTFFQQLVLERGGLERTLLTRHAAGRRWPDFRRAASHHNRWGHGCRRRLCLLLGRCDVAFG